MNLYFMPQKYQIKHIKHINWDILHINEKYLQILNLMAAAHLKKVETVALITLTGQ